MGFAEGLRTGAGLVQSAIQQRDNREYNKRQEGIQNRQMQMDEVRFSAYQRQLEREESDYNKKADLHRLAMESAFLNGAIDDLSDDQVLSPLYMEIFNEQERDRIDPMGDGRKVTSIDQVDGDRWAFAVSGGMVKGEKPITRNRGTAEEGDNIVETTTTEELISDHLGRRQAFEERYGSISEMLDDPESLMRHLIATRDIVNARMTGLGGTPAAPDNSHRNNMALEDKRQQGRIELERTRQQGRSGRGSSAIKDPPAVATAKWMVSQGFTDDNGEPLSYQQAWEQVEDAKRNPSKFVESYVLNAQKNHSEFADTPFDAATMAQEAQQVLGVINGSSAIEGPDPLGDDEFVVDEVYEDADGNRARYLGNGEWEEM